MRRSDSVFRFTFARQASEQPPHGWTALSEADFRSTRKRLCSAVELASESTPEWAEDLLRVARAVYLADKRAPRAQTADRWTRDITLSVELIDPERWTPTILTVLGEILEVMSADTWTLHVRGGAAALDVRYRLFAEWQAEEVALFSGGLDSGAYATQRVSSGARNLLLIGHDHGRAARAQEELAAAIDPSGSAVLLARVRDEPARSERAGLEQSARTRGFLFAATAVYAAAAHGLATAAMPENGQVALNPALSPDRIAANSTRSTHPWVLEQLNRLITMIGGNAGIQNPYLALTKGEVCRRACESQLSTAAIASTVSCGYPPAVRGRYGNCGHCYPCLIRRAGLHAALDEDPTDYRVHLSDLDAGTVRKRQHLNDLRRWLAQPFTVLDLIADMPLPDHAVPHDFMHVIERSRHEIARWLEVADRVPCIPAQTRRTRVADAPAREQGLAVM